VYDKNLERTIPKKLAFVGWLCASTLTSSEQTLQC